VNYFVTQWSKDVWSQMSYSFVKTGGSGEAYDVIAEDVQGKLFFAGEVRMLSPLLKSNIQRNSIDTVDVVRNI